MVNIDSVVTLWPHGLFYLEKKPLSYSVVLGPVNYRYSVFYDGMVFKRGHESGMDFVNIAKGNASNEFARAVCPQSVLGNKRVAFEPSYVGRLSILKRSIPNNYFTI
ncbi:MAG: hypothetical protein DRR42_21355 [Gammaproteobacteria bacterium]|nr:MAG: hypothetical protein DRR42_21355 [Gammaproteobacteria bacterium]